MSSASKKPIPEKLGIKPGDRIAILSAPKSLKLGKLPNDVTMSARLASSPFDLVQAFYIDERALKSEIRKLKKAIRPSGKIWVCWQKGGVTDLNRDSIVAIGEAAGLESVASCALDDEWSALKLMLPKSERKG